MACLSTCYTLIWLPRSLCMSSLQLIKPNPSKKDVGEFTQNLLEVTHLSGLVEPGFQQAKQMQDGKPPIAGDSLHTFLFATPLVE